MSLEAELKDWELKSSKRKLDISGVRISAERLRQLGNDYFKAGSFEEAETAYSESLSNSPSIEAYGNRALARLKLGDALGAKEDCEKILLEDGNNVKALARRGKAYSALGNHEAAFIDLKRACTILPEDRVLQKERDREEAFVLAARAQNEQQEIEQPSHLQADSTSSLISPSVNIVQPPPSLPRVEAHMTKMSAENETAVRKVLESSPPSLPPSPPQSSYAFGKIWRELRGSPDQQRKLIFELMSPADFSRCFSSSLEPDVLEAFLRLCQNQDEMSRMISCLRPLPSFALAKLMLPGDLLKVIDM